jgi:hypothetical protein
MRILVGGSLRDVPQEADLCREFIAALGREIVQQNHILLNGCRGTLDKEIATAAKEWLDNNGGKPNQSIIGYCLKGDKPIHSFGSIRQSDLPDWQMNHPEFRIPEQIEKADATIFVAGREGTFLSKNWAFYARKPILGVPRFGGAGEAIYKDQMNRLKANSSPTAAAEDYETLSELRTDISFYAKEVVALAQRLVTPRNVFTIMSFKRHFHPLYATCQEVCKEFDFVAERTDESVSLERIVPRVEKGIQGSAFVIADVSDDSPNVFYEVGFARGLGKGVIMTAKKGTKLPFDLGDIPTILWEKQEDLKEGLRKHVRQMRAARSG